MKNRGKEICQEDTTVCLRA